MKITNAAKVTAGNIVNTPAQNGFNTLPKKTTTAIILPVQKAMAIICALVYFGLEISSVNLILLNMRWVVITKTKNPIIPTIKLVNFQIANGAAKRNQIELLVRKDITICRILDLTCLEKKIEQ